MSTCSSISRTGPLRSAGRSTGHRFKKARGVAPVRATLVGPDPRISSAGAAAARLAASKTLKGRDVEEAAMWRCIDLHQKYPKGMPAGRVSQRWSDAVMKEAYARCGEVTSEYAKTFYLGTQLMTPEQARAVWAIYVWCRRTDELVDGPNASRITPTVRCAAACNGNNDNHLKKRGVPWPA